MKEETSNTSDNNPENETKDASSFSDAMSFLGAFGELIDKVAKHAEPEKKATVFPSDGKTNNSIRLAIFIILERNKEVAQQQFSEIKHLDIEPVSGYIFAAIDDNRFNDLSVAQLKNIKNFFYQSANDEEKKVGVNACNFKMIFDAYSNFSKHEKPYAYFLSDDAANRIMV
jgi:hypothetical protein